MPSGDTLIRRCAPASDAIRMAAARMSSASGDAKVDAGDVMGDRGSMAEKREISQTVAERGKGASPINWGKTSASRYGRSVGNKRAVPITAPPASMAAM